MAKIDITAVCKNPQHIIRELQTRQTELVRQNEELRKAKTELELLCKRYEQDILKLNADMAARNLSLEKINKELDSFAYAVSHDLQAPLRSIEGFSRALMEDYADRLDAEGRDFLGRSIAATQKMGRLINALVTLSRISLAEIWLELVKLSVIALRIADGLRRTDPDRTVHFVIAQDIVAFGDDSLLTILLENLIENAWKFTGNRADAVIEFGSMKCETIHTRNNPRSDMVYFVKDNGTGFDMNYANKLFIPFQRLFSSTEFPGDGTGLAIVKRIINRHGGDVWIEGERDKGAAVYFTLPSHAVE